MPELTTASMAQCEVTKECVRPEYGNMTPLNDKFNDAMPTALLTAGGHFGSLAAARCLGRRGINVRLADADPHTPTAMSQFVTGFARTPEPRDLQKFGQWLQAHGERSPGEFLYPSSDDVVWIMARNREVLSRSFHLYQPSAETIYELLNKQRLYRQAERLGIDTPTSYYPQSFTDLDALQGQLQYPLFVKPKTQIGLNINVKGLVCRNSKELSVAVGEFIKRYRYPHELLAYDRSLAWPIIQQFHPEARSETYSLSGFVTEGAEHMVVRAAKKVLQQPFQVGIGLAFESRQVNAVVSASIRKLCQATGFYGVFEAELINVPDSNRFLLTDFNPRFFGQMGFDIHRQMPLPYFAYLAALGRHDELKQQLAEAQKWDHNVSMKYSFGWMMRRLLSTQRLSGQISAEFYQRWLEWLDDEHNCDAVDDLGDPRASNTYRSAVWRECLRHPRRAFNYYFR